ncbi:MAG: hypothetical protein ABIP71_05540 [Verrucomicrobiota bacterium]
MLALLSFHKAVITDPFSFLRHNQKCGVPIQNNGVKTTRFVTVAGTVDVVIAGKEGVARDRFVPAIPVVKGATFDGATGNLRLSGPIGFCVKPLTGLDEKPLTGFAVKPVTAFVVNPVIDRALPTWLGIAPVCANSTAVKPKVAMARQSLISIFFLISAAAFRCQMRTTI